MKVFKYFGLLALAVLLTCSVVLSEEEDDGVEVESVEDIEVNDVVRQVEDGLETLGSGASKDIESVLHFVEPEINVDEKTLPTHTLIRFLVGVHNKGNQAYLLDDIHASFRYPQDFSYHIQNFTALRYNRQLPPSQEATLEYALQVHESFAGRPFGLTVLMNYRNAEGRFFTNTLYNETVLITEPELGFDGEALFLYVLGFAILALVAIVAYQYTGGKGKKRSTFKSAEKAKSKSAVETGTRRQDIDESWVPEETLRFLNKSPKVSPRKSPRVRSK